MEMDKGQLEQEWYGDQGRLSTKMPLQNLSLCADLNKCTTTVLNCMLLFTLYRLWHQSLFFNLLYLLEVLCIVYYLESKIWTQMLTENPVSPTTSNSVVLHQSLRGHI